jgi:hypothetical protein
MIVRKIEKTTALILPESHKRCPGTIKIKSIDFSFQELVKVA